MTRALARGKGPGASRAHWRFGGCLRRGGASGDAGVDSGADGESALIGDCGGAGRRKRPDFAVEFCLAPTLALVRTIAGR